jgi:hypothetical protein
MLEIFGDSDLAVRPGRRVKPFEYQLLGCSS